MNAAAVAGRAAWLTIDVLPDPTPRECLKGLSSHFNVVLLSDALDPHVKPQWIYLTYFFPSRLDRIFYDRVWVLTIQYKPHMSTGQYQQGGLIRKVNDPGENNRCVKKKKLGSISNFCCCRIVCFGCSLLISLLCCSTSLCGCFLWYYYYPSFHIIYANRKSLNVQNCGNKKGACLPC